MKLLYANDQRGQHAPSWYEATCTVPTHPALQHNIASDVCVIGAGFTGLSAALELAKTGISVTVLDAHRVGWGASGRNGGQLGSGFNQDQQTLTQSLGKSTASALWQIAEDAKQHVHDLCQQHNIDIEYKPGIVSSQHRKRGVKPAHEYCEYLAREFGYQELEPLTRSELQQHVASDDYHGGTIDHGAGHIHPLKLAAGMMHSAIDAGAIIHELSEVIRIESIPQSTTQRVITSQGSVVCSKVVLATNGYLDNLFPPINRWVMPINNFIAVTEPLGDRAAQLLPQNNAVVDSRFVVNYFRRVDSDRLLFGGGENYSYHFPTSIQRPVRRAMLGVFPDLKDIVIDYAWGGTLAITRSRLPYLARQGEDIYFSGGYSGHGLALASLYGMAIAEHISGRPERFDLLSHLPTTPFPGGTLGRPALLALAMTGYSWLDRV